MALKILMRSPNARRVTSITSLLCSVRELVMVNNMPAIFNDELSFSLTRIIVVNRRTSPFIARKSAWSGIMTLSAAVKALMVSRPRLGRQSIRI